MSKFRKLQSGAAAADDDDQIRLATSFLLSPFDAKITIKITCNNNNNNNLLSFKMQEWGLRHAITRHVIICTRRQNTWHRTRRRRRRRRRRRSSSSLISFREKWRCNSVCFSFFFCFLVLLGSWFSSLFYISDKY